MPSCAIWAGQLEIGATAVPVKLYSAAQDKSVHFHILEAKTKTRVKQHMVNQETGEEVLPQDIRKAYEVERGTFILLDDEELAKLEPKASRDIEITRFVPAGHISHLRYDRPYFLGPDGKRGDSGAGADQVLAFGGVCANPANDDDHALLLVRVRAWRQASKPSRASRA